MLSSNGFDLWAEGYDEAVGLSDEKNTYPFAGYRAVLNEIYGQVMEKPGAAVLDIGFGTGTLTAKLYDRGCDIYGQDFSEKMLVAASEKMPGAHLYQGNIRCGLAEPLLERKYDFIVATYSLHHLTDEEKAEFIAMLRRLLNEGGKILIGDVAFESRAELEACRREAGDEWDGDEIYFVADELRAIYPDLVFKQKSYCAGVIVMG